MRSFWILAAVSLLTLAACSDKAQQPQPIELVEGELPPPREEPTPPVPAAANSTGGPATPPTPGPTAVAAAAQLPLGTPLENERPIGPQDVAPRGVASIGYVRSPSGQITPYFRMQDGRIVPTRPPAAIPPFGSPLSNLVPVPLLEPDVKLPLPGAVDDIVVGGGGRFLLLAMKALQKVGVFDVREGKLLKYVNVESDQFFVAGGATQFVIADALGESLEAWSYDKLDQPRLRTTITSPDEKKLRGAVMGFSSQGPLGCSFDYPKYGPQQCFVELFDLETLTPHKYVVNWNGKHSFSARELSAARLAATPDSRTFLISEGINVNTLKLDAAGSLATLQPERHVTFSLSRGEPPLPAFEGTAFFNGTSILPGEGRTISPNWTLGSAMRPQLSPALPGHYWVMSGYSGQRDQQGLGISFYFTEEVNPVAAMRLNVPPANLTAGSGRLPTWKRLFYNASEKTLVVVPAGAQAIYVKRFDLDAAVAKSETSILQVVSEPPAEFTPGKKFDYAIRTISNRGGATFRLESGPNGMTVSAAGIVEWAVPVEAPEKQTAIIAITDQSGHQVFHNITLARGEAPLQEVAFGSNTPVDPKSLRVGLKLPAPFGDVVVGGGGAYLLAPMPSIRQIAVIDVKQRKIVKLIPADDKIVKIAAGATRFVIYSGIGALSRWNYARLERELTIPFPGKVESLCMGSASEGPILLSCPKGSSCQGVFLDLNTLKPANLKVWLPEFGREGTVEENVASSANGQTFTSWRANSSSTGMLSYVVRGEEAWVTNRHASGGPVTPSPDGGVIYSLLGAHPSFSTDSSDVRSSNTQIPPYLKMPAATGSYYLRWSSSPTNDADDARAVTLHVQGNDTSVMTIPGVGPPFPMPKKLADPDPLFSRRLLYLPVADTVMALSPTMDSVIFQRFVLDEALAKLPTNYLFVASIPPTEVRPSTQLRYQMEVKSRQGGVMYKLAGGPAGAQVSPTGLVTWNVSATFTGKHPFAVHVRDASGAETAHIFTVQIDKNAPATGTATLAATTISPLPPTIAPTATAIPSPVGVARPKTTIKLAGPVTQLCAGGGGRYLIGYVKASRQVAVIDVRERQLLKLIPADDDEVRITAGATKFVVLQITKRVFSRYALATCERELTAVVPPEYKIENLSMGCDSEGPIIAMARGSLHARPIFFDLASLKPAAISIDGTKHYSFGSDVAVSADGRFFMAGNVQCRIVDLAVEASQRDGLGFGIPSSDARIVYGSGELRHVDGNRIGAEARPGFNIPAVVGPYFVRVSSAMAREKSSSSKSREKPSPPTLHLQGDNQTILTMPDVEFSPIPRGDDRMPVKVASERFFLLPTADAMATLSPTEDQILIYRFHFEEELARIENDYLLVVSQPPLAVHPESSVAYQLDVRSKRGGVKYRLETGPAGMTISPSGLISWTPQRADLEEQVVTAAVGDASGRELFHTFKLKIDSGAPKTPAVGTTIPKSNSAPSIQPNAAPPQIASVAPAPTVTPPASPPTATTIEGVPGDRVKHLLKLPATIDDICVGGGGRYLVAQMTSLKQAAIIDVLEKRVVKLLLIDDERFCIAAGNTKLVVALISKNILTRYDLATGARELAVVHSGKLINTMAMGSASEGPLFVGAPNSYNLIPTFLDLSTLKAVSITVDNNREMRFGTKVRVSADGTLFGSWSPNIGPNGLHLLKVVGKKATYAHQHDTVGLVLPGPDARIVYTGAGMYAPNATPLSGNPDRFYQFAVMLPAASGPLFLQLRIPSAANLQKDAGPNPLTLHMQGEKSPILTVHDIVLPNPADILRRVGNPVDGLDKQLLLLPAAEAIVSIPQANDQIIIQHFQLDEELRREESSPLFVASVPPAAVRPGALFQYQVEGKSKQGGLKYRLESGPAGMTVSPAGLVTWKAVRAGEPEEIGIVAVSDASGGEIFHSFRLRLDADASTAPTTTASRPAPSPMGTKGRPAAAAGLRTWKSVDGMFTVEATFEKLADDKVMLLRIDGKSVEVPLDKLCQEDRNFVGKASKK